MQTTPSTPNNKNNSTKTLQLSANLKEMIDHWLSKYPDDQRQSAIIPAFLMAQRQHQGWLSEELINAVADYIGMPRTAAFEVATFYSMLELKPVGKNKISICTNVSCMLNGSDQIVQHVQKKLNIKLGETTQDNSITLREIECLGACTRAPVMLINETYHESLTLNAIDQLLAQLKNETNK